MCVTSAVIAPAPEPVGRMSSPEMLNRLLTSLFLSVCASTCFSASCVSTNCLG